MNLLFRFAAMAAFLALGGCSGANYEKTADGVIVKLPGGDAAKQVQLRVVSERIVRVTAMPVDGGEMPASLMAIKTGGGKDFTIVEGKDSVTLKTRNIAAEVSLETGAVQFKDSTGKLFVAERDSGRSFKPVEIEGQSYYEIRQRFASPDDEAFYGLGQHQNAQMNYKNEDVELAQHNMDIGVPFVVSSRTYGILWDNNSITRFGDPRGYRNIDAALKLYDADGKEGGLTARYYVGDALKLTRTESNVNYQYIKDLANWPTEVKGQPGQRVVWEGRIEAQSPGVHKFQLYSSEYAKVYIDGELAMNRWRQNWNPWYHNFKLAMQPGKPRAIRIEWTPNDGYLALKHLDPLPPAEQSDLSLYSEVAKGIDYYFIAGANLDEVIAGYRTLTGKAVLLPSWAYGFWQSRERYKTAAEMVDTVKEYRRRGLPLDNIVLDWQYWKDDDWGSHEFDATRFPDPKAMVEELHKHKARVMISVWPKFYPTTKHYQELDAKGHIYRRNVEMQEKDWVGPGYVSSFYDPYSQEARAIFWRQIDERLNRLGIDAWWLDASEPDIHSNVDIDEHKRRIGPTALGPGAAYFNSYSLVHTQGVYEGDRASNPGERAFILTRSGFAGLQRHAAAAWSGDVVSRWDDLHAQISAGVNMSMSGLPNWTFDIGGFAVEKRYENQEREHLPEWRELNLRWFQFGAFAPLFRSHGQFPLREIYNLAPEGTEVYESLAYYDRLRYRLMPYIYTLAGDTWHRDYTIMRGLVMDFPQDAQVRDIDDQYLFGPSFLVAPVYAFGARQREVYLPAGTNWYDFYTGVAHEGGRTIEAKAPLSRMPLYVRAGSIVPVGPEIQYTGEKPDAPITLLVYTGTDGAFSLYEDEGTNYNYEQGAYSRIPLSYDETKGELIIGSREGRYAGMPDKRVFKVRFISGAAPEAADLDAPPDASVEYSGATIVVARRRGPADGP
ncbi:MAG TPA: TIM-barrel domain-containing protein [Steroidobacter sp.]|uniref:glycoside hydrolase family 31 protein n=1 Tax=Steroidobacter sp. TaxID=1978227 RepID=UPI002EDA66E5